jgi:hypothetical protein
VRLRHQGRHLRDRVAGALRIAMVHGKVEQQTGCNQVRTTSWRAENKKGLHAEHIRFPSERLAETQTVRRQSRAIVVT